jgi:hypothetical protein
LTGEVLPTPQTIPDCPRDRLYLPVSPVWMAAGSELLPVWFADPLAVPSPAFDDEPPYADSW